MKSENSVEKQHEKNVCDRFFSLYNKKYEFLRFGKEDSREPDCLYKNKVKGEIIGCEHTSIYYGESDAHQEWSVARGERKPKKIESRWGGGIWSPDKLFCDRLKSKLDEKINKSYKGCKKIILVLEERRIIIGEKGAKGCIKTIKLSKKQPFYEIFCLFLVPFTRGEYIIIKIK